VKKKKYDKNKNWRPEEAWQAENGKNVIFFDKKENEIKSHYDCVIALILKSGLYRETMKLETREATK
jgi:hypothetical protein